MRFKQLYDCAEKGERGGQNVAFMEELSLTDYFLHRFAVVGTPIDVRLHVQELQRRGIRQLWTSSPGGPEAVRLLGGELHDLLVA